MYLSLLVLLFSSIHKHLHFPSPSFPDSDAFSKLPSLVIEVYPDPPGGVKWQGIVQAFVLPGKTVLGATSI